MGFKSLVRHSTSYDKPTTIWGQSHMVVRDFANNLSRLLLSPPVRNNNSELLFVTMGKPAITNRYNWYLIVSRISRAFSRFGDPYYLGRTGYLYTYVHSRALFSQQLQIYDLIEFWLSAFCTRVVTKPISISTLLTYWEKIQIYILFATLQPRLVA